jgi:L-lactate dehydrogenase complex protein LldE
VRKPATGQNHGVRVQLFATCLGDLFLPDAVADAETLLRAAGHDVAFPADQTCCGQPAFNAGHRKAAARVARRFERAFSREWPVVCPSGSCATMVARYLPELLDVEPFDVYELSAFMASDTVLQASGSASRSGTGASDTVLLGRDGARRIAYHDSCHLLRELGVSAQPRALLRAAGADLIELERPDLCCGFGGTFSVRRPEVSVAMADDKLADARRTGAEALVTADPGCLLHLRARAARTRGPRVVHLATALARGIDA